ncbi:hypothetical protein BDV10DRAFT_188325 [Aspergillus recurvatus]
MADINRFYNLLMSFILIHRPTARWMILFYTLMDMFWPGWDGHLDDVHEEQWEEEWEEEWEEDWGDEAEWDEQEWDWEEDGGFFPEYMIAYDPFW